jgi:PAS domain S-box-containing protein
METKKPDADSVLATGGFDAVMDALDDIAVSLVDAAGLVVRWNAGAERLTGYPAPAMLGAPLARLFAPDAGASGQPEAVLEAARTIGRHATEFWCLRQDGTRFLATIIIAPLRSGDGAITGFALVIRDLLSRDAARLQASDRQFRLLVQGVVDYAIFMLDVDGRVTTWNVGAQRIKGYAPDEIIGRHFSIFYLEEDRARGLPQSLLERAAREGKVGAEGWRRRKDGTRFYANVVLDAIRGVDGRLLGYAKVTRDITERKEAEERLALTRTAFAQAQKMEALGQLTGGVAHDFNNLLTVVLNNADLLSAPDIDWRGRARFIEGIRRAAMRGAVLTRQLLAFARRQPLNPKRHRVNALIGAFEAVLRRACGEVRELTLDLADEPAVAEIDESQFEGALLNLVVNARDAVPEGGSITLRTRLEPIDELRAAAMEGIAPGRYLAVDVEDTGSGIPPEVLSHVFEPFYTTKEPGKGSGLGLSQVFGFTKQSGGHAEIRSELGRGTVVTLYLPALEPTEAEGAVEEAHASRGLARGTALIVEDDPDVLESAVESMRSLGFEVLTAASGVAALDVLRRHDDVDLLFSDVVMPKGMSGIDLAREARRLRPTVKVLLASGYPRAVLDGDGALKEFALIAKPYRLEELAERLRGIGAVGAGD